MYFNIFVRCPCNIFGEESIFFITNESDNDNNDVLPLDREPLNIAKCDSSIPTAGCAQSQQWAACPAAGHGSDPADPPSGLSTRPIITVHTRVNIAKYKHTVWNFDFHNNKLLAMVHEHDQPTSGRLTTSRHGWGSPLEYYHRVRNGKTWTVDLLDSEKKYERICLAISNGSSSSSFNIIIILDG